MPTIFWEILFWIAFWSLVSYMFSGKERGRKNIEEYYENHNRIEKSKEGVKSIENRKLSFEAEDREVVFSS